MWAAVFRTGEFLNQPQTAGFRAYFDLLQVDPGGAGRFPLLHNREVRGARPAPRNTPVAERVSPVEDPYGVFSRFRWGPGATERNGVFVDRYLFGYARTLPWDFRLVVEQSYAVRGQAVHDVESLATLSTRPAAASTRPPPTARVLRNRIIFESDHPRFKVTLRTADGFGGWRYLWDHDTTGIAVEPPPLPRLPRP